MNSIISIIVPVYNVESQLPKCIESIINQTYSSLEIILVDDGSKDLSGKICDDYALKDCRISVIHIENSGVSNARNVGLKKSSGEYIMFVDADDHISSNSIELLYNRIISDSTDMVIGKHIDETDEGELQEDFCKWIKDDVITPEEVFLKMAGSNFFAVSACAKLYKKELYNNLFFPNLICGEDMWIFPLIVERCKNISVVNETIYYYYQRSNSAMHIKSEKSKFDELYSTLHFVKFLYNRDYFESACKWYERAINKSILFTKKYDALRILKQSINLKIRRKLQKRINLKNKIKYVLLYFPFILYIIQLIKNVLNKGKKYNV